MKVITNIIIILLLLYLIAVISEPQPQGNIMDLYDFTNAVLGW